MKRHLPPFLLAILTMVICLPAPAVAQATGPRAHLNVTPLSLDLPAGRSATRMLVRNQGTADLAIQLRVFVWDQVEGEDRYVEADDIAISPSITRISPGRAQTFHVVSLGERSSDREGRYRVVIDELPMANHAVPGTAQTLLRLTIPLFTDSDTVAPALARFAVQPGWLVIHNAGGRTLRLTDIAVHEDDRTIGLGADGRLQYVHGESWVRVPIPADLACSGSQVRISASANNEPIDANAHQDCS